jgi:hypothetical protein
MTLTELQQEVYTITNRPDLVAETLTAVRSATLKCHQNDFYWKDIFETGVVFDTAEFLQALDYRTLIPLWRSLKYIRKTDVNGGGDGKLLDIIPPENAIDSYLLNRNDVCYGAGSVIQIRSSTALQYIILGCYLNPNITVLGYSSWIALDHPYAIIFMAAAQVFKGIGQTEEFSAWTALSQDQLADISKSNILANGY